MGGWRLQKQRSAVWSAKWSMSLKVAEGTPPDSFLHGRHEVAVARCSEDEGGPSDLLLTMF